MFEFLAIIGAIAGCYGAMRGHQAEKRLKNQDEAKALAQKIVEKAMRADEDEPVDVTDYFRNNPHRDAALTHLYFRREIKYGEDGKYLITQDVLAEKRYIDPATPPPFVTPIIKKTTSRKLW